MWSFKVAPNRVIWCGMAGGGAERAMWSRAASAAVAVRRRERSLLMHFVEQGSEYS